MDIYTREEEEEEVTVLDNLVDLESRRSESPPKHTNHRSQTGLRDISQDKLASILKAIVYEERKRPQQVLCIKQFPTLFAEYLALEEKERDAVSRLEIEYLRGEMNGDIIQRIITKHKSAARFAQKCRWSYQMLDCFDHYMNDTQARTFNNRYLETNPRLKEQVGTKGSRLVVNVSRSYHTSMAEITAIVAEVRPEIIHNYVPPHNIFRKVSYIR